MAYQRLRTPLERAGAWRVAEGPAPGGELGQAVAEAERLFHAAMEDDFNTAQALGHLFDLARAVNRALDEGVGSDAIQAARKLRELGGILGLFWKEPAGPEWSAEILELLEARASARKARDWKLSDELRDRLAGLGALVEDGPQGQKLKRK